MKRPRLGLFVVFAVLAGSLANLRPFWRLWRFEVKGVQKALEVRSDIAEETSFNIAYEPDFPSLAHWDPLQAEIRASFLVPFEVKKALLKRHGLRFPKGFGEDKPWPWSLEEIGSCSFCPLAELCKVGTLWTSFPTDEDLTHLDPGQRAMVYELVRKLKSPLENPSPDVYFRTLLTRCTLQDDALKGRRGTMEVVLFSKGAKALVFEVQGLERIPTNIFRSSPVVCGRALFGFLRAKFLARHVENNVRHGIKVTILYEVGLSRIDRPHFLQPWLESGNLVIVDLRDLLQALHGLAAPFTWIFSKSIGQMLLRADCVARTRPLQPSWFLFLDFDEFIWRGELSSRGDKFADKLNQIESEFRVAHIRTVNTGSKSSDFCTSPAHGWDLEEFEEETKTQKANDEGMFHKYAMRSDADVRYIKVHDFSREKSTEVDKTQFVLRHYRCVNFDHSNLRTSTVALTSDAELAELARDELYNPFQTFIFFLCLMLVAYIHIKSVCE